MYKGINRLLLFCIGLLLLLWCGAASAQTLVIGRVSDNPTKHYKVLKPLLDYVVSHLKDLGIKQGAVLMTQNKDEMIKNFNDGKVDWVTEGVISGMIYSQRTGAEIALRTWRNGTPTYYSVIFTRKESNIHSINDLKGKKIAFEDPGSTSAFFIPLAALKMGGLGVVELPSPRAKAPSDKVGYVFAGDELNIATWVHRGLVDAGAFHNQDWESPESNPKAIKKDLRIFYKDRPVPRMVEVLRKNLDPRIKNRIKETLLRAHDDPAAQSALRSYSKTARFDEFKGEAREGLEHIKLMMKYIGKEIK